MTISPLFIFCSSRKNVTVLFLQNVLFLLSNKNQLVSSFNQKSYKEENESRCNPKIWGKMIRRIVITKAKKKKKIERNQRHR